ncbi:MAG: hypothetical protein BWY57_02174 [Betaproteobacteria bacterium ADurb.Bin341]|jgi:hypothetical protein|nr:MAG: hypothetical protein BWY57_02174 [Betaproteobacteria bacterium ADurb.Bin341]
MVKNEVSFVAFFLMWAKLMGWKVPLLHIRFCNWLETCADPVRVLMVFRGASKSTTYAVYKAWKLYRNRNSRSLIWAADGDLAKKLTRDTLNVLRRHPLCAGMLPPKPGAQTFWVNGAADARNASMNAVGVNQNATGSRADDIDYDDVEVPKNIKTAEARSNLRMKIEESTFIAVPGAQETYIGTPHTHDSIYPELVEAGAAVLKIPLFENSVRYEQTDRALRYRIPFSVGDDGLYVITGIHKFARLLTEGEDYRIDGDEVVFAKPPCVVLDLYAYCAWPERFTREDIIKRRRKTRTLNYWDSQYMLEAKPITETRLDPARIIPYAVEPVIRYANKTASMYLGNIKIAGMTARWDPSSGKLDSDVSAFAIDLQDEHGRHYLHRTQQLVGDVAEFAEDGKRIIGGQVWQICDLVEQFHIPRVVIETNGIGGFAPAVLKAALKQRRLICGVAEEQAVANKNKRILEAYEGPMSSGMLWAHTSVLDGEFWDQMKDFNPETKNQADDYIDAGAGAIADAPQRINITQRDSDPTPKNHHWRTNSGVHEVVFER